MDLNEYQKQAHSTSRVPEDAIVYCALGLNGEAGEVADKIKKHLRDGTALDKDELARELGDILWYISEMAHHLGLSLNFIAHMNLEKLADRAKRDVISGSGDHR